jgi:N-lysine methyltransferase SETD6
MIPDIDVLPKEFDTPMFWNKEELAELRGTEVRSRIGKAQSEEQYTKTVLPIIKNNPTLFDLESCGLDTFHRMGSLVLAYSFGRNARGHDEEDDDESDEEEERNDIAMVPLADMLNANPQLNNVEPLQNTETESLGPFICGGRRMGIEINSSNSERTANLQYVR